MKTTQNASTPADARGPRGRGSGLRHAQPQPTSGLSEPPEVAIPPYGGALMDLVVNGATAEELKVQSRDWPSWDLTPRQLCDLELLLNGGFSPLQGFLGQADYTRVCREMR